MNKSTAISAYFLVINALLPQTQMVMAEGPKPSVERTTDIGKLEFALIEEESKKKELYEERKFLESLKKNVEEARSEASKVVANKPELERSVALLQSSVEGLKRLPSAATLTSSSKEIRQLQDATGIMWNELYRVTKVHDSISGVGYPIDPKRTPLESRMGKFINDQKGAIWQGTRNADDPFYLASQLLNLFGERNKEYKKNEYESDINEFSQKAKSLTVNDAIRIFDALKSQTIQSLTELDSKIEKELEIRVAEIGQVESVILGLRDKLSNARDDQKTIDRSLVYAIYFMIGVVALLFWSVRMFEKDIALAIIEKRSLVEIVSMAFMLITIIILSTGNKLGVETLGTLLGTIAGYIFGTRMAGKGNGG